MFSPFMLIRWLLIGLVVYLSSWVLMVVLARRLPSGLLHDVAGFLPACVTAAVGCAGPRRCRAGRRWRCPGHPQPTMRVVARSVPGQRSRARHPGGPSARGSAADPP